MDDILSFTRTCSVLRQVHLAREVWSRMTLDSVARFRRALQNRWRANPNGVGSMAQLHIALDEAFQTPIQDQLALAKCRNASWSDMADPNTQYERKLTPRDIFYWWAYDLNWRSRRRVWYCVVHGCATARDADWW